MLYKDSRLLFVDTHHIDSFQNITLTLNSPEKRGACLQIEKPWELGQCRASNVVYFEGHYRLYYTVAPKDFRRSLAFVVSQDGVNWERPALGAVDFNGSKLNNLCACESPEFHEVCVFVDPHASEDERFKCICHDPYRGLWSLSSQDGVHFKVAHKGVLLNYGTDNNMTVFWDETIRRYRLYLRGGDKSREIIGWRGSRCVVYAESTNLAAPLRIDKNAPDPHEYGMERPGPDGKMIRPLPGINKELPIVLNMDEMDPPEADLYQAAIVHYAPSIYLAFPTLYYHYPGPPEGFINDGWLDLQFASSRDGRLWNRGPRGSYVRLDMTGGPASKQMHMVIGMIPKGRTLYQYYVGSKLSHGEGRTPEDRHASKLRSYNVADPIAFRLEQRTDGFVSADSAYGGGMLVTKPFVLRNDRLAVNIDTSASGVAYAALLDKSGTEIKECRMEQSDRIQCNDTHHVLSWQGESDLSKLKGRSIRLMLKSRNAKLFAIYPEPVTPEEAGL